MMDRHVVRQPEPNDRSRVRRSLLGATVPSALVFLSGTWLLAAPTVLDYRHADFGGFRNDVVVGSAIAVIALFRMLVPVVSGPVAVVNALLGGWLMAAPFTLDYPGGVGTRAAWNDIVVGIWVIVLSLTGWLVSRRMRRSDA